MGESITIVQIAKESGVSISTVSRVLNGTAAVNEEKRRRVEEVIKKYNYSPNALARGLIYRQSMSIGVILPDISNPYFSAMFSEIERAAHSAGYSVFLCNTMFSAESLYYSEPQKEADYLQMMQDKKVDGALVIGGQVDINEVGSEYKAALARLCAAMPVVVIGREIEGVDCMFIKRETGQGVQHAMKYLAQLGHKRVAFVGGEAGVNITDARLAAYSDACETLGLSRDKELVSLSNYYVADGYTAVQNLLDKKTSFTAMITVNDNVAKGAQRALADVGLTVPGDISILSCDQFTGADYCVPRLTSIDQHNELFGRQVIGILLALIKKEAEIPPLRVLPELIVRESCTVPKL